MAINLKDTVQIIRGKKADIAARTGANGELNWADDTYELYIHDGKTRGGHLIGKASGTAGVVGGAGIAVSTSDGISTVSIKRDPSNVLYATTDGAGVRIGTSGALQITAQNALDLRVAEGGGIIVDSSGVKVDSAVLSSVFRYAGQVNSVDDLPSDAQPGDVYDVKDSGANYVWSGTSWDNLGGIMSVDASPTHGSTNPVASGGVYDAIQDVKLFGDGTTVTVANNIISVPQYEGATADIAATSGLVPPAAAGEQDKVLRGDGEWGEYLQLSGGTMTGTITSTAQAALEQKDSNVSIGDTSRSSTVHKMLAVSLDKDGKRGGGVEVSYSEDGSKAIHFTMRNRTDTDWISLGLKESVDGSSAGTCPNPRDISNTNEIATTAWVRDRIAEIDFPSEVTLSDSVTSTSSTTAASSKAVKTAYDAAVSAQITANNALPKSGGAVTGNLTVVGKNVVRSVGGAAADANGNVNPAYLPLAGGETTGAVKFRYLDTYFGSYSAPHTQLRSDGSSFYILVDPANSDNYNTLRPFYINLTSGLVTMNNGCVMNGKHVVRSVNNINADSNGNVSLNLAGIKVNNAVYADSAGSANSAAVLSSILSYNNVKPRDTYTPNYGIWIVFARQHTSEDPDYNSTRFNVPANYQLSGLFGYNAGEWDIVMIRQS